MLSRPIKGDHQGLPPRVIPRDLPNLAPLHKGTILTARLTHSAGLPHPFIFAFEPSSTHDRPIKGFIYADTRYCEEEKLDGLHGAYRLIIVSENISRTSRSERPEMNIEALPLRPFTESDVYGGNLLNILTPEQTGALVSNVRGYDNREIIIYNPVAQRDFEHLKKLGEKDPELIKKLEEFLRISGRRLSGLPMPEYRLPRRNRDLRK